MRPGSARFEMIEEQMAEVLRKKSPAERLGLRDIWDQVLSRAQKNGPGEPS